MYVDTSCDDNGDIDCDGDGGVTSADDGDVNHDCDDDCGLMVMVYALFHTIRIEQGILWIQRWWVWGNTLRQ